MRPGYTALWGGASCCPPTGPPRPHGCPRPLGPPRPQGMPRPHGVPRPHHTGRPAHRALPAHTAAPQRAAQLGVPHFAPGAQSRGSSVLVLARAAAGLAVGVWPMPLRGGGASPAMCSRLSPDTSLPPPAGDPVTEMHAPRLSVTKPLAGAAAGTEAACGGRSSSGDEDTGRLGGRAGGCGVHGRLRPGRPHAVSLGAEPAGPRAGDPGHLAAPPGPARVHGREAAGPRSAPRQLLELATGKKRTEDLTSAAAEHIPKAEDAQRRAGAGAARLQGRRRQPLRPR